MLTAPPSREDHLAWCKRRAIDILESGDRSGAIASMLSDLRKWEGGELYDPVTLSLLAADAIMFRKAPDQVRAWVEGFN